MIEIIGHSTTTLIKLITTLIREIINTIEIDTLEIFPIPMANVLPSALASNRRSATRPVAPTPTTTVRRRK